MREGLAWRKRYCVCVYWITDALPTAFRSMKLLPGSKYTENDLLAGIQFLYTGRSLEK